MITRFVVLLLLLVPVRGFAVELKVATWNLNWLTTRHTGDRDLPSDVVTRSEDDFTRLAEYAKRLNADLIAIEEVDGFSAATKLFPHDKYSIHMTHDHVVQRVGIVVRRGLHYDVNPDVVGLGTHHLRSGADITLHLGLTRLRILAVHLKKGCRDGDLAKVTSRPCEELKAQIGPIADWIAERTAEGMPFLILGDFNRWMSPKDMFLAGLRQAAPLVRATSGHSSPCWGGENFIDHILAGGDAAKWMKPATLRVLVYHETGREWEDKLSDHCPVSVDVDVPEGSGGGLLPAAEQADSTPVQ